jgi:carboxymethylenebutenolidase
LSETVKLHAADGFALDAYLARPEGTPKGAIVVVQEIFGVNHHIRSVADGYAAEGYLAVAPALFDRYERGFADYDATGMQKAMAILPKMNMDWAAADTLAAVEYARDEYKTKVAVVGFCLGGSVAWMAAARMPVSAAVGYYGGHIAKSKDAELRAPILLHFGEQDQHIPMSDVEAIKQAHPEVPVYTYDADHGFNCDERGSYNAAASKQARERTLAFLKEHLQTPNGNAVS